MRRSIPTLGRIATPFWGETGEAVWLNIPDVGNGLKSLRLARGWTHEKAGLWTLVSLNAPDIEDVGVQWAAPIDWIKPRQD